VEKSIETVLAAEPSGFIRPPLVRLVTRASACSLLLYQAANSRCGVADDQIMTIVPWHVLHSALALPRLNSSVYLRIQRSIPPTWPCLRVFGRSHFPVPSAD
jgi:hypothetical protein